MWFVQLYDPTRSAFSVLLPPPSKGLLIRKSPRARVAAMPGSDDFGHAPSPHYYIVHVEYMDYVYGASRVLTVFISVAGPYVTGRPPHPIGSNADQRLPGAIILGTSGRASTRRGRAGHRRGVVPHPRGGVSRLFRCVRDRPEGTRPFALMGAVMVEISSYALIVPGFCVAGFRSKC
jgi:hypothetical protein